MKLEIFPSPPPTDTITFWLVKSGNTIYLEASDGKMKKAILDIHVGRKGVNISRVPVAMLEGIVTDATGRIEIID